MAVFKRGRSKYWQYEFECGGKRYRGSTKETSKTRAEKFERRERLAVETGEQSLSQKIYTYGQMMDRYDPPASMASAYRMAKTLIPAATPYQKVYIKAHEFRDQMLSEGYRPTTINRRLSVVKRVLNLAHKEWGWIPTSEGSKIVKLNEDETVREIFLTMDELRELASCMEPVTQTALWIASFTGLRRSNVLNLRPEHWDRETKKLTVPRSMTKNKKPLTVPVPQMLWQSLEVLPLPIDDWGLRVDWEQARDKCGWGDENNRFGKRVWWHDLRHCFASLVLSTGTVNLGTLRDIMGHSSLLVTNKYAHLHPDLHKVELDSAFDKIGVNKPQLKLVK